MECQLHEMLSNLYNSMVVLGPIGFGRSRYRYNNIVIVTGVGCLVMRWWNQRKLNS